MNNRLRYGIGILLTFTLFLGLAVPALAVPRRPHVFRGKVYADNELMPEGSVVSARAADGTELDNYLVDDQGNYKVEISPEYDTVFFYVRGKDTGESHEVQVAGGPTVMDLKISDEGPPTIEIAKPTEEILDQTSVKVEGTVTDDLAFHDEITATVAGEEVSLASDGSFSTEVSLDAGANDIEVTAEDFVGSSTSKTITVVSDVEPPALTVTAPSIVAEKTVTVEGEATDKVASYDQLTVTVNGESVELESDGSFVKEVSLTTGSNTISVTAKDQVPHSTEKTVTVVSDTKAPNVSVSAPEKVSRDSVTVEGTVNDDVASYDELTVTLNGESIALKSDGSFSQEVPLESGQNEISVEAVDKAGNSREKTVTVLSDTKAPQIEVSAPSLVGEKTATIEGSVTDEVASAEELSVTLNGSSVDLDSEGNFSEEVSLVTGSNSFTIAAEDPVGKSSEKSVTIVSDTTGPQVNITSPVSGKVVKTDTMTIKATVTDDVASYNEITVTLDGETVSLSANGTFEKEVSVASGQNTFEVSAEDPAGNTGSTDVTVTRDTTAPSITISEPKEGLTTTKDTVTVSGTVEDDIASYDEITLTVRGESVTVQSDGSFSTTVSLKKGTNNIPVTATDGVGNQNQKSRKVERTSPTPWALYIGVAVVIAVVLAGIAIWRRRAGPSGGGM